MIHPPEQPAPSPAPDEKNGGNITTGPITNSTGLAIGPGATATVTYNIGDQQYDVRGLANPYLGLQSFTYEDHAKYAGREGLVAETVAASLRRTIRLPCSSSLARAAAANLLSCRQGYCPPWRSTIPPWL